MVNFVVATEIFDKTSSRGIVSNEKEPKKGMVWEMVYAMVRRSAEQIP